MPIYEYRCLACGAEFEQLVRASDTAACPFCESAQLERKLSVTSFAGGSSGEPAGRALPMTAGGGGGCCGGGCGCH